MAELTIGEDYVEALAHQFALGGKPTSVRRVSSGHINDTFRVQTDGSLYIIQRIEKKIFPHPLEVMHNMRRVTRSLQDHQQEGIRLQKVRTGVQRGQDYYVDYCREVWRCYRFMEGRSFNSVDDTVQGAQLAEEAARAFGNFQSILADIPAKFFYETIPFFHHTPTRYQQLEKAILDDKEGRVQSCQEEIKFAESYKDMTPVITDALQWAQVPEVVVHNDTKINNVLFTLEDPAQARAILDLDTLMPGSRLYDFGDLVRSATWPGAEDEQDVNKVGVSLNLFEALVKGYLAAVGDVLVDKEVELLPLAGKLITYTIGIRFLTDHLNGDTYFGAKRENHNLDRARVHFAMIRSMERQWKEMEEIVKMYARPKQ